MLNLARNSGRMYRRVLKTKKDGSPRETWDAFRKLKRVQGLIKKRILDKVRFPTYLHGGIRDPEHPRDYARNAAGHEGQAVLINEDVIDFFPTTSAHRVTEIWRQVFRFPSDVAECLTKLTTRRGKLPQGAKTSNHLANLAFFRDEPALFVHLQQQNIRYSRLTDDITISSARKILPGIKTTLVAAIYAMLYRSEYRPNRKKHFLFTRKNSMRVNNLVVNVRAGLPREERRIIRTEVHRFIQEISRGRTPIDSAHSLGRLGKLARFHLVKAQVLRKRLASADRNWHN
jgi:hypothetical protein